MRRAALLLIALAACGGEPPPPPPAAPPPPPPLSAREQELRGLVAEAATAAMVGDWVLADSFAQAVGRTWPWGGMMVEGALLLAPARPADPAALRALRRRLNAFDVAADPADTAITAWLPPPSRTVRLYLMGELALRADDQRGIQAAADSLAAPKLSEPTLARRVVSYILSMQALLLDREGQRARAAERLEQALAQLPADRADVLWVGGTLERRRVAEWKGTAPGSPATVAEKLLGASLQP